MGCLVSLKKIQENDENENDQQKEKKRERKFFKA